MGSNKKVYTQKNKKNKQYLNKHNNNKKKIKNKQKSVSGFKGEYKKNTFTLKVGKDGQASLGRTHFFNKLSSYLIYKICLLQYSKILFLYFQCSPR